MHLHNGISHLAVAARPAMPQMSGGFGIRRQPREESQAEGMFRAAGRRLDRSPDPDIRRIRQCRRKKQNGKAPKSEAGVLKSSRNPKNIKKQKTKQASQSNLNQRGLQV